jgi:hypothetical protein
MLLLSDFSGPTWCQIRFSSKCRRVSEQALYLNEAGRRSFLQQSKLGRILAIYPPLTSQTRINETLITKIMAMFSAIKRVVRENNGYSRCPAVERGVVGASANRLDISQCHGQLPQIKTLKT